MKAYDIYKRSLAIMFEDEGEDKMFYNKFTEILNLLICEALPYENSVRASRGEAELVALPAVENMEDEVDMSYAICGLALPYGVAAHFSRDDGELYNAEVYRDKYIMALREAAKCRAVDIIDVYGGEQI